MVSQKKAGKGSASHRAPKPRAQAKGTGGAKVTRAKKKSRAKPPVRAAAKARSHAQVAPKKAVPARGAAAKAGPAKIAKPRSRPAASPPVAIPVAPVTRVRKAAPPVAKTPAPAAPKPPQQREQVPPGSEVGLSEEDRIRSAKYTPRDLPPRLFEEERFLFPETYGVNRVRLLVRDPEWLFAYWDVSPALLKDMGKTLGERTLAVSRFTLRLTDPVSGGTSDILLPAGARWWYVRADSTPRSYKAELGLTLPSGEFRRIAESNTVVTPRVGPSPQRASRRMSYGPGGTGPEGGMPFGGPEEFRMVGQPPPGPWLAPSIDGAARGPSPSPSSPADAGGPGGASDTFRPGGASDVHRR